MSSLGEHVNLVWGIPPDPRSGEIDFRPFLEDFRRLRPWRRILRHGSIQLRCPEIDHLPLPFLRKVLMRVSSRGACRIVDGRGGRLDVGWLDLFPSAWRAAVDLAWCWWERGRIGRDLAKLREARRPIARPLRHAVHLRTDLVFGLRSGGSVAHVEGVVNGLVASGVGTIAASVDPTPGLEAPSIRLDPGRTFADIPGFHAFHASRIFADQLLGEDAVRRADFVYQRLSMGDYSGLILSRALEVPFVLEYNGSELWIQRNWGESRVPFLGTALAIEDANLMCAELVVAVSDALAEELVSRGVPQSRILVNPNGVDVRRYSPDVSAEATRSALGLQGKIVVGFIGTFGPWHGAEVLAAAYVDLVGRRPDLADRSRLLLVGDGARMPLVRAILEEGGAMGSSVLTGLVPQEEGPAHLAAMDVVVNATVPNPDGSRFFGSPTKLFEYMGMGKAIISSDIEQAGDVLRSSGAGVLVSPADPGALSEALETLLDDPAARIDLGARARRLAVEQHTWQVHVERILARIGASGTSAGSGR